MKFSPLISGKTLSHSYPIYIYIYIFYSLSRSISVGIVWAAASMAFAFTQKTFPTFVNCLTFHGTFYVYAAIAFVLTAWAVLTIKLTDGLSLVETERLYDCRTTRNYESVGAQKNDSPK